MSDNDDLLREGREAFQLCSDAEHDNRQTALDDIRFAREGLQWPAEILKQRDAEGRPALTINKLPAFIRQVVNDARQNKPSIKVHPADSGADVETAEIINGLIRNIEYTSNADVAYDTATECAVGGGFGYIRVGLDYAHDDTFDMDISIDRVVNPFSIYGDPLSTAADSSDWNIAFAVDRMPKDKYEAKYKDKASVDFDGSDWSEVGQAWMDDKTVLVAEWWKREEVERAIVRLQDGTILDKEELATNGDLKLLLEAGVLQVNGERIAKAFKVTQRIMSGCDILEDRVWPGRYIPIIPVYGDEFDIEGKRYFRSLIHNAIDAQRMFNYWRTTGTELVALAPRVPYIGPKGAFDDDDNWQTANTVSHPYLEYKGATPPQRQPLDMGVAAGALQEALNASDDMKAIIGMYDASLGARSNETSGRAIMARQREGDVSTFHFIDNMARAIRHTGRVLIDLIPKVYTEARIIRVLGEDGKQEAKPVNQPVPVLDDQGQPVQGPDGAPMTRIYDLTSGKYDLTVTTGPSFTTRREEAAYSMTEALRAFPDAAPVIVPELAKNLDWPGADDIAKKLEALSAPAQIPPEVQKAIEEGRQTIQQQGEEIQNLKLDQQVNMAKLSAQAEQDRLKLQSDEQIEMLKIESNERIAEMKIASEARIQAQRAAVQPQQSSPAR